MPSDTVNRELSNEVSLVNSHVVVRLSPDARALTDRFDKIFSIWPTQRGHNSRNEITGS